jgi:hypothetical protein
MQDTFELEKWSRHRFQKRRVNLRLIDGSVIVNVQLLSTLKKTHKLRYRTPFGNAEIALEQLLEIEPLPLLLYTSKHVNQA